MNSASVTSCSMTTFTSLYGNCLPLVVRLTVDQLRRDVPAVWIHMEHTSTTSSVSPRVSCHSDVGLYWSLRLGHSIVALRALRSRECWLTLKQMRFMWMRTFVSHVPKNVSLLHHPWWLGFIFWRLLQESVIVSSAQLRATQYRPIAHLRGWANADNDKSSPTYSQVAICKQCNVHRCKLGFKTPQEQD